MKKEKKQKEKQLNLGLRNTPANIYYKYKDRYNIWSAGLETKKFIKDVFTWFIIILSLSFIATEIYTIQNLSNIPTEIPVFNYFVAPGKRLAESLWIYIYPAIGTTILLVGLFSANIFYHKERELSKVLLLSVLLTNLSLCMFFLKLVYTF